MSGGRSRTRKARKRYEAAQLAKLEPCHCTTIQQDETCPIGYPSLLCDDCDGTGNAPTSPHA